MRTAILLLLAAVVLAGTASAGFDNWKGMPDKESFEKNWDSGKYSDNCQGECGEECDACDHCGNSRNECDKGCDHSKCHQDKCGNILESYHQMKADYCKMKENYEKIKEDSCGKKCGHCDKIDNCAVMKCDYEQMKADYCKMKASFEKTKIECCGMENPFGKLMANCDKWMESSDEMMCICEKKMCDHC
jgi:hypothetical protein